MNQIKYLNINFPENVFCFFEENTKEGLMMKLIKKININSIETKPTDLLLIKYKKFNLYHSNTYFLNNIKDIDSLLLFYIFIGLIIYLIDFLICQFKKKIKFQKNKQP